MKQVLFVCLGNICRSPSAEAVFNALVEKNGLAEELKCDSAGTAAYHAGDQADYRMKQFAIKRGYRLTSISRPVDPQHDFDHFDYIIGMDSQNVRDLKAVAEEPQVATKHDGQECIQKITPRKPNQFNPLPGTQNQSLIVFTNTLQFSWD